MAMLTKQQAMIVVEKLGERYPDAKCALHFTTPLELLIATMLSAQCTDVRVNIVTEKLFRKYRTPEDYAEAPLAQMQEDIREVGLFRTKAQNIISTNQQLLERFGGNVPANRDALTSLPGVGRKTANVVLSNAFDIPAFAVDTHVLRVSNRIGLANGKTPDEVERQVCRKIPKEWWTVTHHRLIHHGRQVCVARNPKCDMCPLQEICQYYIKNVSSNTSSRTTVKSKAKTRS